MRRHRARVLDAEGRELSADTQSNLLTRSQPTPTLSPWTSAGGVVLRRGSKGGLDVALVGRGNSRKWALPKGTIRPGEPLEITAAREVREETGLRVRMLRPLDQIHYTFRLGAVRYSKTVHFYIMTALGGDTSQHDHEYDEARWFSLEEALKQIAYPNEARLVELARFIVANDGTLAELITRGGS